MALYEYQCENCGELFEVIQKFADQPLLVHEKCGGSVHRLISAPALQFKGSGWYVNDYPKGGNSSSDGAQAKGEGSSDSKPASSGESSSKSETASTSTESKSSSTDKKSTDKK